MHDVLADSDALVEALCDAEVLADSLALVEALCDADVLADSLALVEALMRCLTYLLTRSHSLKRSLTLTYLRIRLALVDALMRSACTCGFDCTC